MDSLLPVDLLVAAKLAVSTDVPASVRSLGDALGMSKSAVAYSLRRLVALDLIKDGKDRRHVNRIALRDCFEHGARWIAPKLHALLAIIDTFRVGRARDRQVAAAELRARL